MGVAYGGREGREYPVIVVPEGVRSPVAAKKALEDGGRTLIRLGDVYFRTLAANGTPSTAPARPQDWPDIVEICFNNRESRRRPVSSASTGRARCVRINLCAERSRP